MLMFNVKQMVGLIKRPQREDVLISCVFLSSFLQRLEVQQNQGLATRFLQTTQEPQHTVSASLERTQEIYVLRWHPTVFENETTNVQQENPQGMT